MTVRGIDVAHYQGEINWQEVKDSVDFVFMKATEGTTYIDPEFARNRRACRELKIPHAFYHYIDCQDPIAEANHFVDVTEHEAGEGQSLDFEGNILHHDHPARWAKVWLDRVHERTGNRPIAYMSGSVTDEFDWHSVVKDNYALWEAAWGSDEPNPGDWPFWAFWQTSAHGHVQGISGEVDLDRFNGDLAALKRYFSDDATAKRPASKHKAGPTPVKHPLPGYYIVQRGDTMRSIAARYGTTAHHLIELNDLSTGLVHVGQHLRVHGALPAKERTSNLYTVKAGDTMIKIAEKFKIDLHELLSRNPKLRHPDLIFPGEHISI